MKSRLIRQISVVLALIGVLMVVPGMASAKSTVTTGSSTAWAHSAVLNGTFESDQGAFYGFEYGTTTAYGSEVTVGGTPEAKSEAFSTTIKGLSSGTTYHYRAVLVSGKETVSGTDKTFTTGEVAKFHAAQYPAIVSGEPNKADPLVLGLPGGSLTCETTAMTGGIFAASSLLSLTPSPSGCKMFGSPYTEVKSNGCVYSFWAGDPGLAEAALEINCPPGKSIEVVAGNCTMSIPSQQLSTVTANQQGLPSQISLDLDIPAMDYTVTKDGLLCGFAGTGAKKGTYSGTLDLKGTNVSNTPIGLLIGV